MQLQNGVDKLDHVCERIMDRNPDSAGPGTTVKKTGSTVTYLRE
jgi:hypothetical protein